MVVMRVHSECDCLVDSTAVTIKDDLQIVKAMILVGVAYLGWLALVVAVAVL